MSKSLKWMLFVLYAGHLPYSIWIIRFFGCYINHVNSNVIYYDAMSAGPSPRISYEKTAVLFMYQGIASELHVSHTKKPFFI